MSKNSEEASAVAGRPAFDKWEWEKALLERSIREGLTPAAQHIALVMATYADGRGEDIRPTAQTVARVAGRSRSTVQAALKSLRDQGWLTQITQGSGAARQASVYRLSVPMSVRPQVHHQTK